MLVFAGGSNLVIADDPDRPDRGAVGQSRHHRRRQPGARRGGRGLGRRGGHGHRARSGRAGMPVRHPGIGRRHPGAERRSLRRRSVRHHHPGPAAGSRAAARCAGYPAASWASATAPACSNGLGGSSASPRCRPGSGVRAGRIGPQCAVALRRADGGAGCDQRRARRPASWSARRCWPCGPARAWCSTRPTTTPGAWVRSSPTRWSRRTSTTGWPRRTDGPVPHYPAPDGVKLAAGWLVERAGLRQGLSATGRPRSALPAVHQACACSDQPRRRHRRGRDGAGPHRPRRGPRCVWHHTETRTCPAGLRAVAANFGCSSTRHRVVVAGRMSFLPGIF